MGTYIHTNSPVFTRFFEPAHSAYLGSRSKYNCPELTDLDFLEMGVLRCLSDSRTGRDFLQRHGDNGRKDVAVDLWFKGLKSQRRLSNLESVNGLLAGALGGDDGDPFAAVGELDDYAIYAGDGHYHGCAAHDKAVMVSRGNMAKRPPQHFFILNLRTHHLGHLALAEQGGTRKTEHDMRVIKRSDIQQLRGGEPKGRKVVLVWDRAGIDLDFWYRAKHTSGLYFLSREKENMRLEKCGNRPYDRDDPRNAGVVSDELVGPGASGGATFRRVIYIDPVSGERYAYITTEMNLPPGIIALIYKQRWDIEKVFDELKSKLLERKSWASGETAKTAHAIFLCITHNLLVLLESKIRNEEGVDNGKERERKARRLEKALEDGANFVATAAQRFTVRCLKFIRWLRNFTYSEAPWRQAVARLRAVYEVF